MFQTWTSAENLEQAGELAGRGPYRIILCTDSLLNFFSGIIVPE